MAAILQQLFAQTDTGVAVVDRSHCIVAWNPGAERMFGWPAPEIQGRDVVKLLALEGSPMRRYIGAALLGDVVQAVPVRLRNRAGDVAELILTCRGSGTHPTARPTAVLFIDPTPRHQTIASTLAQRTRELQRIIGAFPDLFFWTDAEGRVLDYNAGTEVDLTIPQEQFLGCRVSECMEGEAGERLQAAIGKCLREHRTVATEYTRLLASGRGYFEARIIPLEPERIVAVVRDITARRRLEEGLARVTKMEAIGRLAGGIAHDFNNLLTVVYGCVASLREEVPNDGPAAALLDEQVDATQKAALLVRQLLAFSQRQPTSPRALDLNRLVLDDLSLLTRLVATGVTVSLDLSEAIPWVFADPVQLDQVLFNLCANARDAMPGGGQLTIRTELRQGRAALIVSDTGVGMDPQILEHAFEPFFTTKGQRGTGIGLATVHGIVSQLGGRIEVVSQVGSGTTFTVLLPHRDAEAANQPAAGAVTIPARRGTETVLIVEDEAAVRKVLVRVLHEQGYRVLESDSFETALHIYRFRRDEIRLVVSDVVLPGRSGHELAAELRDEQPGLPIVLLSAYDEAAMVRETAPGHGMVILQKPPAFDELLRVVRAGI
ncbi:MAG TPA: ATP-binding protein, partial [Gemmatimonadales bacterium]|nr:ATP-binding protein [Gemmatimonadales bacterium]